MATNGTWTDDHINKLWGNIETTTLIYPPCDTRDVIEKIPIDKASDERMKKNLMVSIGQFRPEKDHML